MNSDNSYYDQLLSWFKLNGGYLHPSLERRSNQNGIFGIYATGPISPNKELIRIPDNLIISHATISREMPPEWADQTKVIYNLLLQKQLGPESFYQPIFKCLPTMNEFKNYHPFFISSEEKARLKTLDVSYEMLQESYEQGFKETETAIQTEQEKLVANGSLTVDQTLTSEEILWGFFVYKTRAWGDGIIPIMDMFNHSNQSGSMKTTILEPITDSTTTPDGSTSPDSTSPDDSPKIPTKLHTLVSKIDYYPGDQVYDSYGSKDNIRLAYDYGFQDPENLDLVIPFFVNFTGRTPLHYGIARRLIERGMKATIKEDQSIYCFYQNYYLENDKRGLVNAFTDQGVTTELVKLFQTFAINNYSELEIGQGQLTQALKLLKIYLDDMLKNTPSGDQIKTELDRSDLSAGYRVCLLTLQRRIKILEKSREWIIERHRQVLNE